MSECVERARMTAEVKTLPLQVSLPRLDRTSMEGVYHHITRDPNAHISNTLNNRHLRQLTLGLATALTASGGPGEVSNGDDEEAVAVISQTSEGVVPSGEGSQEAEETTSHDEVVGGGSVGADQVADTEHQVGDVQEEEQ